VAKVEHIEVTQRSDGQWNYRRVYANGRRGERSEESFVRKHYAVKRAMREHPDTPVRVVPLDEGAYWAREPSTAP
jgi:hypothetical protein